MAVRGGGTRGCEGSLPGFSARLLSIIFKRPVISAADLEFHGEGLGNENN